jgi:plastocyanin domain-containing protein
MSPVIVMTFFSWMGAAQADRPATDPQPPPREIEIVIDGTYKPNKVTVQEGERIRLKFVKKDSSSCTKEVVFPTLNIKRELSPEKPVLIDLPALPAGEVAFKCGMNMVKGALIVEPKK